MASVHMETYLYCTSVLCFSFSVKVGFQKESETTPCKNQNEHCHVYELAFVD